MKKLIFFLLLLTAPLRASVTFVQAPQACVSDNLVNSFTCTFNKPVAAGDTLIVSTMPLLTPGTTAFNAVASDSLNGNLVHGAACYTAYDAQADMFYLANSAAGADTVTVTYTNLPQSAEMYISMAEYSGVNTSAPFDVGPFCSAYIPQPTHTPYTYAGPALQTTEATDTLISSLLVGNAGTTTISAPYVERVPSDVAIADATPGAAGTQPGPTWTTYYSQDGFIIGAALRAASGGGGGPTIVTVGPHGEYTTPCAAFPHLVDGDTVQIDANGGTPYQDASDCTVTNNNLTITGVNGRPIIDASKASLTKAIWVIDGHDDVIDNFEFRDADNVQTDETSAAALLIQDSDGNGGTTPAGGNITVQRSYVHDNFNGIVSRDAGNGNGEWNSSSPFITLQSDEFANNGYGDGQTHNIYIGYGGNMDFTLQSSWSHDAYAGNDVKSRAPINNIRYNLIGDSTGNTSYLIDLPEGGSSYIIGNSLYKMATTHPNSSPGMLLYADVNDNSATDPEYGTQNQDLHFINNTVVLDPANQNSSAATPPAFVLSSCADASSASCPVPANGSALTVPGAVENNIFFGAETAAVNQLNTFAKNNLMVSNSPAGELASLKFNNPAAFDFRLTSGSPATGAGVYPPTGNSGSADSAALALYEYLNSVNKTAWPAPSGNSMDAGAFSSAVPINTPSLSLSYPATVQAGNGGTITVSGLPAPVSGQYNYASFLSSNEGIVSGTSSLLGPTSGEGDVDSAASGTTTVSTTFVSSATVTTATVVPVYVYVDGTVLTANITITPPTQVPASIAAVSGSGQSATVGSAFANPLIAIVKDANSNPVSGATVTFAGSGVSFPGGATAITGSNGEAEVTAQPTTAGALTITASVSGVGTPASFSETGNAETQPTGSIAFVQAPAACVSGTAVSSFTCKFNKPVAAGDTLILSTMALLTPTSSPDVVSASDNLNGAWTQGAQCYSAYAAQANFFYLTQTAAGSDTVTVTYSGIRQNAKLYISMAEYSGVNLSSPFDVAPTCSTYLGKSPFKGPSITTSNANDLLISAMNVGNAGKVSISAPYAVRVPTNVTIADATPGTAGVQAGPSWTTQYNQDGFVIDAALQPASLSSQPASISTVSGSGQSATAGTQFANPLVVVVKDTNSNPVSGAAVTFVGTGVNFPAGATAMTGSNGEAQVTAEPTSTGSLAVTASVAGVTTRASFSETGTTSAAASIGVVSGSGQSTTVGTPFTSPLVVIVKDTNSNPVSGVTVTFAGTGVSFPAGATTITGSNGEAQVTAEPTGAGSLTVTASVAGVSAPANFSETGSLATTPVSLQINPNPIPANIPFTYSVTIGSAGSGSNPVGTITLYAMLNGTATVADGPNLVGSAGQSGVTAFSKTINAAVPPGSYYVYAIFTPAQGNSNPAGTSPQVLVTTQ